MVERRFGALPVVKGSKLVGIVTETDLLRYFAETATDPDTQVDGPKKKPAARAPRRTSC